MCCGFAIYAIVLLLLLGREEAFLFAKNLLAALTPWGHAAHIPTGGEKFAKRENFT